MARDLSFEELRQALAELADVMDRRDTSPPGRLRREQFDHIVMLLIQAGLDHEVADDELRKLLRGEKSAVLIAMGLIP